METKCTSGDRSLILRVLQQELGERPVYHFAPEFRYSVGGYSLLRDGRITAESDGAGLFPRLAELGLCDYPRVPKLPEPEEIAFPMETQNGRSLLNLLCILTARQILLNRALALRPGFLVTGELVEDLIAHPPVTVAETLQALYGREEEHRGVRMDLDFLVLTGFAGGRPAEDHIHRQMGERMVAAAISQNRVKPFTRNIRNKKYMFRFWINAIGMRGPEYEEARRVMLARLPGRTACRSLPRKGGAVRG